MCLQKAPFAGPFCCCRHVCNQRDSGAVVKPVEDMPGWVRWIAQDSTGAWWGYSVEPLRNDSGWYENEAGRYVRLGRTAPGDWRNSLERVR
jgi:hypothetical protein